MSHLLQLLCKVSSLPCVRPYRPSRALEDEPDAESEALEQPESAPQDSESVISPCVMEHELYKQIAISRGKVSKVSTALLEEKR